MESIGKYIMLGGLILLVVGGLVFLSGRLNLPLGHLPGDIHIHFKNGDFYFPLVTCILLSVLLTGLLALINRFLK